MCAKRSPRRSVRMRSPTQPVRYVSARDRPMPTMPTNTTLPAIKASRRVSPGMIAESIAAFSRSGSASVQASTPNIAVIAPIRRQR